LFTQDISFRAANALLKNVLDAASEISIVATDLEGMIVVFNSGAERMLGYSAAEVVNKQSPAPFHLPAEVQARAQELSAQLGYPVEGFRTFIEIAEQQGSEQREWTYIRKNGAHISVSLVITTMHSDTGEVSGYLGIAQDITERKRIDKMKSEFVSTVSHELRTPLTSISGALGLISGGAVGEVSVMAKQMINIAYKNSKRLTFLINDLLDMEKLVAGKMSFEMKSQALMPILEQSIEDNRPYGLEKHVTLRLVPSADNVEVFVDVQRLHQVMSNLLSNAIKYSPENDTVDIAASVKDNWVRVTVSDHGQGIPAEFTARIFSKFSQADSSDTRQKGGTGLGLAISRELVERMGGKISFNSVEHQGAHFHIDLPICITTNSLSELSLTPPEENSPLNLVVEDEPDIAKLITIMLTRAGYAVDIAETGKQALVAIKQKKYAAMTLDLMLPDISGIELIRTIRGQPDTGDIAIVVISAKMEEGRLAIAGDFSEIDWLAKPINELSLLSMLGKRLDDNRQLLRQVLHVEDDADLHQVIKAMTGENFEFTLAESLQQARARLAEKKFDLVMLDIGLPDGSGWLLLPEIRILLPNARVIILSGENTKPDEARKVEAVLFKSQFSIQGLMQAINGRK
jgi:PAS domain S-box-containing protein